MERRRYPRIPVKLHATLIGQNRMPRGCRVINLSQQGALLQCEHNRRPLAFSVGEAVELHLTLKRRSDDNRRGRLRATIRRVTEQYVGIEFEHPDPELVLPFEAYRRDDLPQADLEQSPGLTTIQDTTRDRTEDADGGEFRLDGLNGTWRYFGLSLLTIAIILLVGAYIYYVQIDTRFSRLEAAIEAHARNHGKNKDQVSIPALLETRMGQLKARLDELENFVRENKVPHILSAVPMGDGMTGRAEAGAARSHPTESQAEDGAVPAPVAPEVQPAGHQPGVRSDKFKPDVGRHGSWVINLLSSQNKDAVDRFSANARAKEIPVTQTMADVKGKQYWRVQLTGFATADEAKSYAELVKQKLGLQDVWIFRDAS